MVPTTTTPVHAAPETRIHAYRWVVAMASFASAILVMAILYPSAAAWFEAGLSYGVAGMAWLSTRASRRVMAHALELRRQKLREPSWYANERH
jgi:hypothetical protein